MSKIHIGIIGAVIAGSVATPIILKCRSQAQLRDARAALKAQSDALAIESAEN